MDILAYSVFTGVTLAAPAVLWAFPIGSLTGRRSNAQAVGEDPIVVAEQPLGLDPDDDDGGGGNDVSWSVRFACFCIFAFAGTILVYTLLQKERDQELLKDYENYLLKNDIKSYSQYLQTVKGITAPGSSLASASYYATHVPTFHVN